MAVTAPPVVVGDILMARVICYSVDQISMNIYGYRVTAVTGASRTIKHLVDAINSAVQADYKTLLANDARYRGVGLRRLTPNPTLEFTNITDDGVGSAGANMMGRQVAGMFTKTSPVAGSGGRGRVYMPFPSASDTTNLGHPTAGYQTRLGILAAILMTGITDGAGDTATISPIILKRASLLTSNAWTGSLERAKWATQKRRGDYGKTNPLPF